MQFKGIAITGTRGSGKTALALKIKEMLNAHLLTTIATRGKRDNEDNEDNEIYDFVTVEQFNHLKTSGSLAVSIEYMGNLYGIKKEVVTRAITSESLPICILAPEIAFEFCENYGFMSFFLDAEDSTLDSRLDGRKEKDSTLSISEQRHSDRGHASKCNYFICKASTDDIAEFVRFCWHFRYSGGILSENVMLKYLRCGLLFDNYSPKNVQGASYDLSLGHEFYYGGKVNTLSESSPFIVIEPYDYAIVTSEERVNLPRDVAGTFDLCVSLFCQGIILSNGPQVDPGFRGILFCLLFNTSNRPVILKIGQHYATVEFTRLFDPAPPYTGKYQNKDKIMHYLPSNTMFGAINDLKKDIERLRKDSRQVINYFLGVVSLILAIIAILLVVR